MEIKHKKLLIKEVLLILGVSRATYNRLIKKHAFPKPEEIGKKHYQDTNKVYEWLSDKAGRKVSIGERLYSSVDLRKIFNRSPTWVWIHFQKNEEWRKKAIYLMSRPHWLESEVFADEGLQKYLEVREIS